MMGNNSCWCFLYPAPSDKKVEQTDNPEKSNAQEDMSPTGIKCHILLFCIWNRFFTVAADKSTRIDDTEDPFPEHAEFERIVKDWDWSGSVFKWLM